MKFGRTTSGSLKARQLKFTRDGMLFFAGLAGIAHETLVAKADRPTLLFAFMAMVGLPAFLRADEKKTDGLEPPEPPPEPTLVVPPTPKRPARRPLKKAP